MNVKGKIKKLIANNSKGGEGYANACQIWKGYGENGEGPRGWWLKPFGENARWIGNSWKEIKENW